MAGINERILLTAGACVMVSHGCEIWFACGPEMLCVDKYFIETRDNLNALLRRAHFEMVWHTITNSVHTEMNRISDLACRSMPVRHQHDPAPTPKASVHGAMTMLDLATRIMVRILQSSTSEGHGDPVEHAQRESERGTVNCTGPRFCCYEGKRCPKTLFFDCCPQHGGDMHVACILNTFGLGTRPSDGLMVFNVIVQALRGEPITRFAEASRTRAFCNVDDLVQGLLPLMGAPGLVTPGSVGNPIDVTIRQLAELFVEKTRNSSVLVFRLLPLNHLKQRRPDISLAAESLKGSQRCTAPGQGINRTVASIHSTFGIGGSPESITMMESGTMPLRTGRRRGPARRRRRIRLAQHRDIDADGTRVVPLAAVRSELCGIAPPKVRRRTIPRLPACPRAEVNLVHHR